MSAAARYGQDRVLAPQLHVPEGPVGRGEPEDARCRRRSTGWRARRSGWRRSRRSCHRSCRGSRPCGGVGLSEGGACRDGRRGVRQCSRGSGRPRVRQRDARRISRVTAPTRLRRGSSSVQAAARTAAATPARTRPPSQTATEIKIAASASQGDPRRPPAGRAHGPSRSPPRRPTGTSGTSSTPSPNSATATTRCGRRTRSTQPSEPRREHRPALEDQPPDADRRGGVGHDPGDEQPDDEPRDVARGPGAASGVTRSSGRSSSRYVAS